MNNLLFTAIIIALLYYFFYYLPNQKKNIRPSSKPFTRHQETQTDPETITRIVDPGPDDTLNGPGAVNLPGPTIIHHEPSAHIQKLQNDI